MSAHNLSLELVLTFNNSSKAKRELIQKIINQEYGENIHLTVIFQKSMDKELLELSATSSNFKVLEVGTNLEDTCNAIISQTAADYIYFCSESITDLRTDMAKLLLEYAEYFSSDIICFGVKATAQNLRFTFAESVSNSEYAAKAIFKSAARNNLLAPLCNKIFKVAFLKSNNLKLNTKRPSNISQLEFNIRAFSLAQKIQATSACLAYVKDILDFFGITSHNPAQTPKITEFCKLFDEFFKDFKQGIITKDTFFTILFGLINYQILHIKGNVELEKQFFLELQNFINKEDVNEEIKDDYETVFINHFSENIYAASSLNITDEDTDIYFYNLIKFHQAENQNCISEAIVWLIRFVYNKNNTNKLGLAYLNKLVSKTFVEERTEYEFIKSHNLQETIANNTLAGAIKHVDSLFEEGNNTVNYNVLDLIGLLIFMSGDIIFAVRTFNDLMLSPINSKHYIPKTFFNIARVACPIEYRILCLFKEHKNWLTLWNGSNEDINKLAEELEKLNYSCEKNIILARLCLKLNSCEEAAYFYKEAINHIRNNGKYPIEEAIYELSQYGRDDLVDSLKK